MEFVDTAFLTDDKIRLVLKRTSNGDTIRQWLPAYYFLICDHFGTRMGECDLRIGYNENTYYGGNIGYSIGKSYRGNHYAGRACRLLFKLAKRHGMKYLIITCNPDNYASRRTCEYAGGILQEIAELPRDNDMRMESGEDRKCIYRFTLD